MSGAPSPHSTFPELPGIESWTSAVLGSVTDPQSHHTGDWYKHAAIKLAEKSVGLVEQLQAAQRERDWWVTEARSWGSEASYPASGRRIEVEITGDASGVSRELHYEEDGSGTALPPIEESVPRGLEPISRIAGPRHRAPGAGTDPSNQERSPHDV